MWRNYYTNEVLDVNFASKANGGTARNCAVLSSHWNGWMDIECIINKAYTFYCACQHLEHEMYLQLRGLCPYSNIDSIYIVRNKQRSGKVNLLGFKSTVIEYDLPNHVWRLRVSGVDPNTKALSNAPMSSYVLGTHEWLIESDNIECNQEGKAYRAKLKLTGCREGEFTCSDGQCIRGQTLIYQMKGIFSFQ